MTEPVIANDWGAIDMMLRTQEERTWHGTFYGIPYDFRRPTFERLRDAF